ncbi:MAG: SEC-C metal-binding domain-containing protein [Pseudomonadota bacterium]
MTKALQTEKVCGFLGILVNDARDALTSLNSMVFDECAYKIDCIKKKVLDEQSNSQQEDTILNDFFVIHRVVDFLHSYSQLWERLIDHKFSSSWYSLQDALDLLRLIKRFSSINVEFFENQLLELAKLYPYGVFVSLAFTVEKFQCSICGLDIDSLECPHFCGEIYGGKMAQAVATNIVEVSHAALVSNPRDKRCVPQYEDTGQQFNHVRYLADLMKSGRLHIFEFGELRFSKKLKVNPNYVKLGRNEPCYCNSGKKFKKCCISKEYLEVDHVDIVASASKIDTVLG